jgi:hypothetical protein
MVTVAGSQRRWRCCEVRREMLEVGQGPTDVTDHISPMLVRLEGIERRALDLGAAGDGR